MTSQNIPSTTDDIKIKVAGFSAWYGDKQVLKDIDLQVKRHKITALIGPSGCGKTTLLRSINLMNRTIPAFRSAGQILLNGINVYSSGQDEQAVRRKVGMVFQQPNPFPTSIFKNMEMPIIENLEGLSRREIDELIRQRLVDAHLYEEVSDRLKESALRLSGGQQQRLCIARALTIGPEVLLLDEPCAALDPVSTAKIESLLIALKEHYTIVIVTHNLFQASRIADHVAFFYSGRIAEQGATQNIFLNPQSQLTADYIRGAF